MNDALSDILSLDWVEPGGPNDRQSEEVRLAFRCVSAAADHTAAETAKNMMLFAVGNNSGGTVYPIAAPAAAALVRYVRACSGWPRWTCLEVLIDLLRCCAEPGWSDPKPGIEAAISSVAEMLERIMLDDEEFNEIRRAALEVLERSQTEEALWRAVGGVTSESVIGARPSLGEDAGPTLAEVLGEYEDRRRLTWFKWYTNTLESASVTTRREGPYRCPCCHRRTLGERAGFEICPVCFWEDDGQDDHDADIVRGGPNGRLSLTQARVNYLQIGACELRSLAHVRPPRPEED
jgi:hypothetical protein